MCHAHARYCGDRATCGDRVPRVLPGSHGRPAPVSIHAPQSARSHAAPEGHDVPGQATTRRGARDRCRACGRRRAVARTVRSPCASRTLVPRSGMVLASVAAPPRAAAVPRRSGTVLSMPPRVAAAGSVTLPGSRCSRNRRRNRWQHGPLRAGPEAGGTFGGVFGEYHEDAAGPNDTGRRSADAVIRPSVTARSGDHLPVQPRNRVPAAACSAGRHRGRMPGHPNRRASRRARRTRPPGRCGRALPRSPWDRVAARCCLWNPAPGAPRCRGCPARPPGR
jgi:hypothetical protein